MRVELADQVGMAMRKAREIGRLAKRLDSGLPDPARELRARARDRAPRVDHAIDELCLREARCERLRSLALAPGERRLGARDRKAGLALQVLQQRELALGHPDLDPRERHIAIDVGRRRREHRRFLAHLGLGALAAQAQLLAAHEVLRESDLAHRHEIATEAEAVAAFQRKVFDAGDELRIRELRGGHARLPRGTHGGFLGAQERSLARGEALRLRERERLRDAGRGRGERQHSEGYRAENRCGRAARPPWPTGGRNDARHGTSENG